MRGAAPEMPMQENFFNLFYTEGLTSGEPCAILDIESET